MQECERRRILADFLRQRRARLAPADVGLPVGTRRHTPGLRREEVAQLANIGVSWYVWLEQGRDVHPSAQVLESLARALKLTLNERRHLFLLAGEALPALVLPVTESVSLALQQVLDGLNPTPAYAIGQRYDYIAWNHAADALFTLSEASSPYGRNLIWRLFTNPTMRARPNWEHIARATLAEFRVAHTHSSDDGWFAELIEDLKRVSPEFCCWWPLHDVRGALDGHKVIEHPMMGTLEFEHINLQVLSNPDIKIMVYSPNDATRVKMQRFLEA